MPARTEDYASGAKQAVKDTQESGSFCNSLSALLAGHGRPRSDTVRHDLRLDALLSLSLQRIADMHPGFLVKVEGLNAETA